ncbi:receptor like protein 30-like [Chenopodium quinoa]|uniref:receptor like protein 30-like n=1 Tax=Chenopodium quinoa TaxID=63459 RepID=UPI000B7754FE|nr:receptor like protein 30-like [Chenopodium quinoa]
MFFLKESIIITGMVPKWMWGILSGGDITLNLSSNHFVGIHPPRTLSNTSKSSFFSVTTLTLDLHSNNLQVNGNFLQGQIPGSLANCKALQVLDLGNNRLYDTLPCHLESLSDLKVLVLRSNNFHGTMVCLESPSVWPQLQIVDLASNHFNSGLTAPMILKWTSMMASATKEQTEPGYVQSNVSSTYYQNSVTINLKGHSYELQYILITFTSIDFSSNAFHGELPRELGNLNALVVLNLSHNSFWGHIPSSFGNLSQIESLDLSCNALTGKIPGELGNLNFLGYLNLSFNKLTGMIPTSTQLQSFDASSYEGNQALYGPPLTEPDSRATPPTSSEGSYWSSKNNIEWMLMGAEVGFPVGIMIFIGPLLYIKRYREWYCKHLHRLVMKILRKEDKSARGRRGRRRRNQQRQMR